MSGRTRRWATAELNAAGRTASRELDIVYDSHHSPSMVALFDPEFDTRWIRAERSAVVDLNTMD
jgi:hypothetical protein